MKHLFSKKTYPSLRRDFFGYEFENPIALEPQTNLRPPKMLFRETSFAFREIGPFTSSAPKVEVPPSDNYVLAANISNMRGRTASELTKSILSSFSRLYDSADMFVLDTFREDSDGIIALQNADVLSEVMDSLLETRRFYDSSKPILVRVSPAISQSALSDILHYLRMSDADGIIAGYDSYCPELVQRVRSITGGRFPLVACGEINSPARAAEMLSAGADIIQVSRLSARRIIKSLQKQSQ